MSDAAWKTHPPVASKSQPKAARSLACAAMKQTTARRDTSTSATRSVVPVMNSWKFPSQHHGDGIISSIPVIIVTAVPMGQMRGTETNAVTSEAG